MSSFIFYVDDDTDDAAMYCDCVDCGSDDATAGMGNLCADCYWDKDSQRKKEQRADPVWRFNRIVSFALTCMNMDNASAIAFALKTMNLEEIPSASPLNEKK
jgi:hypothetical protein